MDNSRYLPLQRFANQDLCALHRAENRLAKVIMRWPSEGQARPHAAPAMDMHCNSYPQLDNEADHGFLAQPDRQRIPVSTDAASVRTDSPHKARSARLLRTVSSQRCSLLSRCYTCVSTYVAHQIYLDKAGSVPAGRLRVPCRTSQG